MDFITKEQFQTLAKKSKYWKDRWGYTSAVIELLRNKPIKTALELGPYNSQVALNSDIMDLRQYGKNTVKYVWDARKTPWPITTTYDVFIALQVWEHLYPSHKDTSIEYQQAAFAEVMRISKSAVLSFPYKWKHGTPSHNNIDASVIKRWTLEVEPVTVIHVQRRVIYYFDFGAHNSIG